MVGDQRVPGDELRVFEGLCEVGEVVVDPPGTSALAFPGGRDFVRGEAPA
ncbi:hypothetical protein [Amycolatopsis sp. DG1A-15b]|nr:hypothetical protein [Amycolatopsis sp. DG1A-15b]WIX89681.1 hypothetical protein QRY02_04320 [Amycolatopsis sp. DG1A-15b]